MINQWRLEYIPRHSTKVHQAKYLVDLAFAIKFVTIAAEMGLDVRAINVRTGEAENLAQYVLADAFDKITKESEAPH